MARTQYGPRAEYIGTGLLSTYTFDFMIKSLEHLIVGVVDTAEAKVFRVRGSDVTYLTSVTFTDAGGQVVLASPLAAGYKLYILLADDSPLQESQFKNKGAFTLSLFEDALDVLSGQIQRLNYQVKRSLKIGDQMVQAEADSFNTGIPFNTTNTVEQDNSDKVVCVGSDNKSFKMGPSVVTLAGDSAAAVAAAAAAAISEANAATSATSAAASSTSASASATAAAASAVTAAAAGGVNALAAVGSVPNGYGGSISGQTLTLQPADSTNPGLLTSGAQAIGGIKSFIDFIRRSAVSGLTAFAGGGQASATQLTKDINRVTTVATANDSVKLPDAIAGSEIVIINKGAAAMNVYPKTGESINALAANVAYSIAASSNNRFICAITGVWDVATSGVLRAANVAIGNAVSSVTVVFSSVTANANYVPILTFINTTDSSPIFMQGIVTAKTTSGFTVTFNTPTDSANYLLGYQVNDSV